MFEVIICTVSTGRVQRQQFDTWEAARRCVDHWTEKKGQRVRVTLERAETPVVRPLELEVRAAA
jgi:hypothetical protein